MLFYAKKGLAGIYTCIITTLLQIHHRIECTLQHLRSYFLPEKITLTDCKKWRHTQFPYIEALAIICSLISNVLVQYSLPSFPHESPNKTFHCLIQHITRYQTCIKRSLHTTTHIKNQTFVFKSSKLVFAYTLSNSVRF